VRSRERIALWGCAITLSFAGLALGGAVRWAALGASLGAIATAIPFVTSRRSTLQRSPLLLLLALAIGLTALQLVPLPAGLANVIAHAKLELVTDNAGAFGDDPPAVVMASYDPPATLVELAKLVGYAALAFAATRLAAQREHRRYLAMVVVGATVVVALVTFAHSIAGATAIYGAFIPPAGHPLVSPIINDNHFASLMAMAPPVALALAVTSSRFARAMWIGAALVCAVACLLVSSRGGAIGLAIGLVVSAALILLQHRVKATDERKQRRLPIPALVIGGCIAILVVTLAAGQVMRELSSTKLGQLTTEKTWKVQGWGYALEMLGDNPWLGTGRGAFEPAFSRWSPVGDIAYSHAENTYVQVAVDWGIPGGAAILVAAVVLALAAARRWRQTPLEAAALGALVSLAAHDVVDFSIELPVVAMTAILLIAILVPARLESSKLTTATARAKWGRGGMLALALAVCVVAATSLGQLAHAAAAALADLDDPSAQLAAAQLAAERHPADYLLIGRAAQAFMELGDPRAVPVISRALYFNPAHAGLHRLAATMLLRAARPAQAQAELALAVQHAPYPMLHDLVEEIVATFPGPADAARAFPLDPNLAEKLAGLVGAHKEVAFEYTRRLALLNPHDYRAQLLHARAAIATGHGELALVAAHAAFEIQVTAASAITLATAQALGGDATGGIATLRAALASGVGQAPGERVDVLGNIADLEISSGALGPAAATLDELAPLITDHGGLIRLHLRRATLHDHLGEPNLAKWERSEAARVGSNGGS
jgi:O-antigen ligase